MNATLIALLFASAACLSLGAIAVSWRAYGAQLLALRQQLASCDPVREVRFTLITTLVRSDAPQAWRPGFSPRSRQPRRQHHSRRPLLLDAA